MARRNADEPIVSRGLHEVRKSHRRNVRKLAAARYFCLTRCSKSRLSVLFLRCCPILGLHHAEAIVLIKPSDRHSCDHCRAGSRVGTGLGQYARQRSTPCLRGLVSINEGSSSDACAGPEHSRGAGAGCPGFASSRGQRGGVPQPEQGMRAGGVLDPRSKQIAEMV